jgi:hypothetical protein
VTLPTNYAVTLSGVPTLDQMIAIDAANGSGAVSYAAVSGSIADLLASAYVTGAINVTVTGAATVAQMFALDQLTSGTLTYSITDTAASLVGNAGGYVTGVAATVTDTASIAQLTAITGTALSTTYTSVTDTGANLVADAGTLVLGSVTVAVSDTISAADAATIAGYTTGVVTATVTADTAANLATALTGLSGDAFELTVSAGSVAATDLIALNGNTTETVNAAAVTTVTGTAANVASVQTTAGVTLPTNYAVTLSGVPTLDQMIAIDAANGSGAVSYAAVNGSIADLLASVYVTSGINTTVTDAVTIAQLTSLDALDGNATHTFSSGISDTLTNIVANVGGYVAGNTVNVTDASITVAQALTVAALTASAVTATLSTNDITTLLTLNDVANGSETGNLFTVVINDTAVTVANLNDIDDNTASITINGDGFSNTLDFTGAASSLIINAGDRDDVVTGGNVADTITLGAGNDTVIFESLNGSDTVTDYSVADDSIQLSNSNYGNLNLGALGADFATYANDAAFTGGSSAASTDSVGILFDQATGNLYYNADSAIAGGLTLIGTFSGGVLLVGTEFTVIA